MEFDPKRFLDFTRRHGHPAALGLQYVAQGSDWCELRLPYQDALVGDPARGLIASGAIIAALDMAAGLAIWIRTAEFRPTATIDMRIDYLRPAAPGRDIFARVECYRLTRRVAFVRGEAHDGDADNPVAHVAASFMRLDVA